MRYKITSAGIDNNGFKNKDKKGLVLKNVMMEKSAKMRCHTLFYKAKIKKIKP